MLKRFYGSKKGFTLAEVLITLGIIGVVAAMTIPTLIQNTNSVKFASQFKKSISTLSQAALMAQAQYDVDYSLTSSVSSADNCGKEIVSGGNITFCGLLNNTLAGQTYLGTYGSDKVLAANGGKHGGSDTDKYTFASTKVLPSSTEYLVYSLADGSYVGFDPAAVGCGLGAGNVLDASVFTRVSNPEDTTTQKGLKNCIGFIDVNGPTPPNKEVECSSGETKLDPSESCNVERTGSSMGDIFPVVFHDGVVEPASNAAKMVLTRGK
ncbi:type II secretion system protein [bacterium]|nr:type II secretion system protein [bacterium]MBR1618513.1 type II secretion system protein [bacterium]